MLKNTIAMKSIFLSKDNEIDPRIRSKDFLRSFLKHFITDYSQFFVSGILHFC